MLQELYYDLLPHFSFEKWERWPVLMPEGVSFHHRKKRVEFSLIPPIIIRNSGKK